MGHCQTSDIAFLSGADTVDSGFPSFGCQLLQGHSSLELRQAILSENGEESPQKLDTGGGRESPGQIICAKRLIFLGFHVHVYTQGLCTALGPPWERGTNIPACTKSPLTRMSVSQENWNLGKPRVWCVCLWDFNKSSVYMCICISAKECATMNFQAH